MTTNLFRTRLCRRVLPVLIAGLVPAGCATLSPPAEAISGGAGAQHEPAPDERRCQNAGGEDVDCDSPSADAMFVGGSRYLRSDSGWSRVAEEPCPPERGPADRQGPFPIPTRSADRKSVPGTAQAAGRCPDFTTAMVAKVIPQIAASDRIARVTPGGATTAGVPMVSVEFEPVTVAPHLRAVKSIWCDCFAEIARCTYFREDEVYGSSPPYSFTLGKGVAVETAVEIRRLFEARAIDAPQEELERDWALPQGIDGIRRCGERYYLDWSAENTGGTRVVRIEGSGAEARLRSVEPAEWYCAYPAEPVE